MSYLLDVLIPPKESPTETLERKLIDLKTRYLFSKSRNENPDLLYKMALEIESLESSLSPAPSYGSAPSLPTSESSNPEDDNSDSGFMSQ